MAVAMVSRAMRRGEFDAPWCRPSTDEGGDTLSGLAPEYDVPNRIPVSRTFQ